jgi:hypothetical protein
MIFCKYKHLISNQKCKVFFGALTGCKFRESELSAAIFTCYLELFPVENRDFGAIRYYLYLFFGANPAIRYYLFRFATEDIRFYRG